jgi:hypothetical protein
VPSGFNYTILYYGGGGWGTKFTALKVPRQCPLVLLVEVSWIKCKSLGSEEGKVMGSDGWEYGAKGGVQSVDDRELTAHGGSHRTTHRTNRSNKGEDKSALSQIRVLCCVCTWQIGWQLVSA